jgi:peptide/nickel transport system permease protein
MKLGLCILGLFILMALFVPWIAPYDPTVFDLPNKLQGPSSTHWLGTDAQGSDLFSLLIFGTRLSLFVAITVNFISLCIGLILGSLAGYYGGLREQILMRFIDGLHAFPGFLLALAIVAFLGPGIDHLIFALCITGWTFYARLARAEIQNMKPKEFVLAAQAVGAPDYLIIVRHLWPNLASVFSAQVSFGLAGTIISEAGLSFLGLGAPAHVPSWGSILGAGRKNLLDSPHITLSAACAITLIVLSFNLIGDGLTRGKS